MNRRKELSPLAWLAGGNKPDAWGFTAIDPGRWEAVRQAMQHHTAGDTGAHVALKPPRAGFYYALGRADGRVSYH